MNNLFDKMFEESVCNISHIPPEFQTIEMCRKVCEYSHYLLKYCYCIDMDMLNRIFKSMPNVPKKARFGFINNFDEDALIRLVKIDGRLMANLKKSNMTDKVIRAALESEGY